MNPREGQHFRPSRGGVASWCGVFFLQRKTIMTTVSTNASPFSASLPIVAAALGRSCGVAVEFGASVPSTNGKTIYLPDIEVQTEKAEREVLGLLMHECGHVRFTDVEGLDTSASPFEQSLDNALEDVRIERAMDGIYPGAEALFKAAHREPVEQLAKKRIYSVQSAIPLYALSYPEHHLMGREYMAPLVVKLRKAIVKNFGEPLARKLEELTLNVAKASSLADVQAIRREIVTELQLLSKQQEPEDPAKGTAQDKDGDKEPNGSSRQNSASGNSSEEPQSNECAENAKAALAASTKQAANPLSLSEAFKQLKCRGCSSASNLSEPQPDIRPVKGDAERGAQLVALGKADAVALRRALMPLVQSKLETGVRYTDRGRRIDTRRLCRLSFGNARVFCKANPKKATGAAVHILLDLSGSMGSTGAEIGLRASLGIISALQGIRHVNPALTVFPGEACGRRGFATCSVIPHGTRLERVDVREIGGIDSWGPTPIAPALRTAGKSLAACRESAKIVLLITDGVISASMLRSVVDDLSATSVKAFGIQIGCDSGLERLLPRSIHISSVEELKTALFTLTKDAFNTL